jgi:pectate lyase
VTLHHNWFKETPQRHPRLRFGRAHVFNNYFYKWKSYGIGCSYKGQCRSENNIFAADKNKKAIIDQVGTDSKDSQVRSDGDWLLNGAYVTENDRSSVFNPASAYAYTLEKADASLRSDITNHAGWQ